MWRYVREWLLLSHQLWQRGAAHELISNQERTAWGCVDCLTTGLRVLRPAHTIKSFAKCLKLKLKKNTQTSSYALFRLLLLTLLVRSVLSWNNIDKDYQGHRHIRILAAIYLIQPIKISPHRKAHTIRAYLHSFSSCCLPNLQNPAKFRENMNL